MGHFSVSAATVTLDQNGHVLLIRRADNNQWQIPGGVVELGEEPTQAAIRETFEESGIEVSEPRLTGVYTNVRAGIVAMVFRATNAGGQRTLSDESTAVEFFPPAQALELVPEIFRPRISDALRNTAEVSFRAHDGQSWLNTTETTEASSL